MFQFDITFYQLYASLKLFIAITVDVASENKNSIAKKGKSLENALA